MRTKILNNTHVLLGVKPVRLIGFLRKNKLKKKKTFSSFYANSERYLFILLLLPHEFLSSLFFFLFSASRDFRFNSLIMEAAFSSEVEDTVFAHSYTRMIFRSAMAQKMSFL